MCGVTRKDKIRNEHIRGTTNAGFQQDHGETIELVLRARDETRGTPTEESVENGYCREKGERTTENKTERRVPTRHEKYWTESGRSDAEKEDKQSYRRPYMMGKPGERRRLYTPGH